MGDHILREDVEETFFHVKFLEQKGPESIHTHCSRLGKHPGGGAGIPVFRLKDSSSFKDLKLDNPNQGASLDTNVLELSGSRDLYRDYGPGRPLLESLR